MLVIFILLVRVPESSEKGNDLWEFKNLGETFSWEICFSTAILVVEDQFYLSPPCLNY